MASKLVIAVCHSGGQFLTNEDGNLTYDDGVAFAIDLYENTTLADFKKEVLEAFNWDLETNSLSLKYFIPGNNKTLITISKDKDLGRMVSFVANGATVDVFVSREEFDGQLVSTMLNIDTRLIRETVDESVLPFSPSFEADVGDDINCNNEMVDMNVFDAPLTSVPSSSFGDCRPRKAVSQWANIITGVDQRFSSFKDFRDALHKYSLAHNFTYKYKKNDSHRVSVKCKQPDCPWRIYASKLSTTQLVCIKKMNPEHTCNGSPMRAGYRATRGWVGSIIKEKLKQNPDYKPKDIVEDMKLEYGIQLNYSQAWRAKEIAREQLQGSYKDAYGQLPNFCEEIRKAYPGSIATYSTKEDSSFHRLFLSFGVSIAGFQQGCRPLIFLDNHPLNSRYQGVLLTATAADGLDGIFPVAFAVVDVEIDDNWHWFLKELKSAVLPLQHPQPITFVADFQNGLKVAISQVFGDNCHHAYCLRHLWLKLSKTLMGQYAHDARRIMNEDFHEAAYAPTHEGFYLYAGKIKDISLAAYEWVIASEPTHWATAFFQGSRYNLFNSNFGQSFYSWVSGPNEFSIKQLVEGLRDKIMEGIAARREDFAKWNFDAGKYTVLIPAIEGKIQAELSQIPSYGYHISQALESTEYHVSQALESTEYSVVQGGTVEYVVDINSWNCTCGIWQLSGLPCSHALTVLQQLGHDYHDYCLRYFRTDHYQLTYQESISPLPNEDRPAAAVPSQLPIVVNPPPTKRLPGRPKASQVEQVDMLRRQLQCSRCKGLGHNKKTCKDSDVPLTEDPLLLQNGQVIDDYKIEEDE